jgi:hypothetical protein
VICDGGSADGTADGAELQKYGVNTLLIKTGAGAQGAQLRMGFWWAITRGYAGVITIDGNNKDGIEDVSRFAEKLDGGFDFVQGSRFIEGGAEVNTPKLRRWALKLIHAPIISLTARKRYTDTTNNFRAYSVRYLTHPRLDIFRDIFSGYELLAYLSVRASRLKLKCCEIPVKREYPAGGETPTKIKGLRGNARLVKILFVNMLGLYSPHGEVVKIRKAAALIAAGAALVMLTLLALVFIWQGKRAISSGLPVFLTAVLLAALIVFTRNLPVFARTADGEKDGEEEDNCNEEAD